MRSRFRIALVPIVLMGVCLLCGTSSYGLGGGAGLLRDDASPQASSTIYLPLVGMNHDSRTPFFGVQSFGWTEGEMTLAADVGARWVRLPVAWSRVEPSDTSPDGYTWEAVDSAVWEAGAHDRDLIMTLSGQPSWAATYPAGPVDDLADLIEFFEAWVERYDGDGVDDAPGSPIVEYYELYNEPDNADVGHAISGWGYWGHNGAGYGALMEALYPVGKAANPRAKLVVGGLALDWFEEQDGPFDAGFLDDVLAECRGKACFDVMNFHYYPLFRANWEVYGEDVMGKAAYVRQKLAEYGFGDTPIVCTEISWASGADWGSDELQSRYVVKGYVRALAAELEFLVWYALRDGRDGMLPGLFDNDLQGKPSYHAYQHMATALHGARYQRTWSVDEAGSDLLRGYVFERAGRRLDVVWTEDDTPFIADDDPFVSLAIDAKWLWVRDRFGNEQVVHDAEDGAADGKVTLNVGGSPLYLEYPG